MTPLSRHATKRERDEAPDADLGDSRDTDWSRFVESIHVLLATGQFTWAAGTLRGIQETVTRTQWVTSAQRRAVWNIEAANRWRRR